MNTTERFIRYHGPAWVVFLLLLALTAEADVNLAAICRDATPPADTTCQNLIFDQPAATDYTKGNGGCITTV